MQAIILAAGMGKRLKDLTNNNTKCMVKVNGVTMIQRMLNQLDMLNLKRIVIVVGYKGKQLIEYVNTLNAHTKIEFIDNPIYFKTNNIYSLSLAKKVLCEDDTILLESDLIFEDSVLKTLIDDERDTLALVDKYESWMDGTCVKLDENDSIQAFVPGKHFTYEDIPKYYKTVNIYKFSTKFSRTHYVPFLSAYENALGENEYYEQVLRVITMLDDPQIKAKRLNGEKWYEIDDIQDLNIAESIFANTAEEKLHKIEARYGGYWRYPNMVDYCYLVNPFFPPQKMVDEIKANFEKLLVEYPSGMAVNSLIAAKNFGVKAEHIAVGNGAAELIKELMERIEGHIGVIRPTFEEYPNRMETSSVIAFNTSALGYHYTADDIISFFSEKLISCLVLINPDNPSGNYIPKKDVIRLVEWTERSGINLIIDESFIDFSDEEDATLIKSEFAEYHKNTVIIKSISKSFGVPGIRLGVLFSGNTSLVSDIKHNVSIWNINSYAEFYMQIYEKYNKDYNAAMKRFRIIRAELMEELKLIDGLRVLPSQANYVMCNVLSGISSRDLVTQLMNKYNFLVKDLSKKCGIDGEYIRIAVKKPEENTAIANAIREILNK